MPGSERAVYPNLKLQLWRSGIRQNRLAAMLGIDETLLSKIINGFREPGPELRRRIAGLLRAEERWLFERAPGLPGARVPEKQDEPR